MALFLHPLLLKLPSSLLSWGLSEGTDHALHQFYPDEALEGEYILPHHPDPVGFFFFLLIHVCAGEEEN